MGGHPAAWPERWPACSRLHFKQQLWAAAADFSGAYEYPVAIAVAEYRTLTRLGIGHPAHWLHCAARPHPLPAHHAVQTPRLELAHRSEQYCHLLLAQLRTGLEAERLYSCQQ